jgi:hypothetical protein
MEDEPLLRIKCVENKRSATGSFYFFILMSKSIKKIKLLPKMTNISIIFVIHQHFIIHDPQKAGCHCSLEEQA